MSLLPCRYIIWLQISVSVNRHTAFNYSNGHTVFWKRQQSQSERGVAISGGCAWPQNPHIETPARDLTEIGHLGQLLLMAGCALNASTIRAIPKNAQTQVPTPRAMELLKDLRATLMSAAPLAFQDKLLGETLNKTLDIPTNA